MTTEVPSWYLPDKDRQPSGPFTAEQILEDWRAGNVSEKTVCWCEGMTNWLPLSQVEPFASHRPPSRVRRWVCRVALGFGVVACLVVAGLVVFTYWTERSTIQHAKDALASREYGEAVTLLRPFCDTTYFYDQEAQYLLAVAEVRQCATAIGSEKPGEDVLNHPRRELRRLIQSGDAWRERAGTEFADLISSVSKKTPDSLERCERIAGFLEELKLADAKQLGQTLLAVVKAHLKDGGTPAKINATFVATMLRLDPALSHDVLAATTVSDNLPVRSLRPWAAVVVRWTQEEPSLAKPLGAALLERGDELARREQLPAAEVMVETAELVCPELQEACLQKRLGWLKVRLANRDFANLLPCLDGLKQAHGSTDVSAELASLCLEAARQTAQTNGHVAQQAIDRAFQLQPALAQSEENLFLWISVRAEPSDEKRLRCQQFVEAFPTSGRCDSVRMEIIRDAITLANSKGATNVTEALDTAYRQAIAILKQPNRPDALNSQALVLAQGLADAERYAEAAELAELFGKVFPDSPRYQEIAGKIVAWRAVPQSDRSARVRGTTLGQEDLNAKLLRRKRTISTPTAVHDAVANNEVWIIEVADSCTADQFDAEQTRLLRTWVSDGGVLWVNSSVLSLFGIQYSHLPDSWSTRCEAAGGTHPVLEGVRHIQLNSQRDKSCTLEYRGVIPLLALKEELGRAPVGTTVWSLVPYGKGWVSDPKPIDLEHGDGSLFWGRFCQFCLRELPWDRAPRVPEQGDPATDGEAAYAGASFSGIWVSSDGARFRIDDDGKTLAIDLISGGGLRSFSGRVARAEENPDPKSLTGTLDVVYEIDAPRRHLIRVTVTLKEHDPDHLYFRGVWPVWSKRGGAQGTQTRTETLSRVDADADMRGPRMSGDERNERLSPKASPPGFRRK